MAQYNKIDTGRTFCLTSLHARILPPRTITADSGQSVSLRPGKKKKERHEKNELGRQNESTTPLRMQKHFMFIIACFIHLLVISPFIAPAVVFHVVQ